MINEYKDPYQPDEEEMVEVGDYRPWGHEVHIRQTIGKRAIKQREIENQRAVSEWYGDHQRGCCYSGPRPSKRHPNAGDNRILCHRTSPWADCIEALEIYESKTP